MLQVIDPQRLSSDREDSGLVANEELVGHNGGVVVYYTFPASKSTTAFKLVGAPILSQKWLL